MESYHNLLFAGVLFSLAISTSAAGKTFELKKTPGTGLKWRGANLITEDHMSYLPGMSFTGKLTECQIIRDKKNWTVVNTWGKTPDMSYRKEIASSPDGKIVELSIQMTQPPYKGPDNQKSFSYTFKVPVKVLSGMKWRAITGRGCYAPVLLQGTLSDSTRNGDFIGASVRWLALTGNGKKLVFDFNPEGVTTFNDFGPNRVQGLWQVRKEGEMISFSFGRHKTLHGGTLNSKVLIFEGDFADYSKYHPHKIYRYFSELPPAAQYSFGADKPGSKFKQAGTNSFSEKSGFGWQDAKDIKQESSRPSGVLYSSVAGNSPAVFKTMVPVPGLYLISVRSAAYAESAGPFKIECDGKTAADRLLIKPNTVKTITWPQWLEKGFAEFKFSGNWRVSVIALQVLQSSYEDYRFRRGFWRIAGLFEPSVMHKSSHYAKSPVFKTATSEIPLPAQEIKDPEKAVILPPVKAELPDQQSPQMAWRFGATIGSIGPGNNGNFDEFNTPELAEKRLKELKDEKINTVLLNGFLSRHTFQNHLERVQEMVKMTTAEAKKLNIKIIDHWDLTLLWNNGSGFRYLSEHTDWLQRTVEGGLPNRGLCPVNPEFKEHFFEWVTEFIKYTRIDGIMIDEVAFHGLNFCGCEHCRRQFHQATGLTLPLDETSPLLMNKRSNLWKSWLSWRLKVTTQWWVDLRRRINKINPYFTIMRYTTHYGFYSTYATLTQGASLNGAAHGCDFIGTEIMSRNVMASYRAVAAFRKFKNAFREAYGSPVFGLIYPVNSPEFAYFGWVLNNMNAQVTWYISGRPGSKDANYTAFADNIDLRTAKPAVENALLFSLQTRDWNRIMPYYPDPLGTAECMNDLHMQYTTLIEASLKYEKLKEYKTVMVPSAACLSDRQIDELLKYVRNGGRLFLSAHAGILDEIGNFRKAWPFAEPLGLRNILPLKFVKGGKLKLSGNEREFETGLRFIRVQASDNRKCRVFLTLKNKLNHDFPVGVENDYGKGKIFYVSGQLGKVNMEPETTIAKKWMFKMNRPIFDLYAAVLDKITGGSEVFNPVNIPENVLCTVYEQPDNGGIATAVHLLNASGIDMKFGKTVPKTAPKPAFPALTKDIKFIVKLANFSKAYAASPDFTGHKAVKVRELAGGRYEVTVPKELLKCYSIIWLR